MLDFQLLQEKYATYVSLKDYKTGCGNQYTQAVHEFCAFLAYRGAGVFAPSGDDIADYFKHLTTRSHHRREGILSVTTINHHLFGLRILFNYLLDSGYYESLPRVPKNIKMEREPLEILSVDEIKALYENAQSELETALISTAYGCGLRRSEIASLKLTDVDVRSANLIVRSGKGSKRREVPLSDKVREDFKAYIHGERIQSQKFSSFLFISATSGTVLSGNTLNTMIKNIAKRTDDIHSKRVTLHTLRRSIATHLAENGAGIHFIKDFLGHAEIDTAQLYAIRRKRQTKIT